jgi:UDP-N-acetylglucosamine 2-epimerase (non-hydrolysing)
MKIMVILGTRPEIIKLSEIIKKLDIFYDVVLVHTGQNYSNNLSDIFFEELELRQPDYYLNVATDNLGKTMGNVLEKTYEVMEKEKPDALLVLGDTNSGLSVISAKRLKIPIFHLEAGNRCFDLNTPEEINRKIIDHTSDINMCYSEQARQYLINEGMKNDFVFVIGSPLKEVINKIDIEETITDPYMVLSLHREENVDNNLKELINKVNKVAETFRIPIIFTVHPRTQKKLQGIELNNLIQCRDAFGFKEYLNLQKNAFCVISDSGTLSEEASLLKFPAVSLRQAQERPEAFEKGNILLADDLCRAIRIAVSKNIETVDAYSDINVSDKVLSIIESYTQIINKRIWSK